MKLQFEIIKNNSEKLLKYVRKIEASYKLFHETNEGKEIETFLSDEEKVLFATISMFLHPSQKNIDRSKSILKTSNFVTNFKFNENNSFSFDYKNHNYNIECLANYVLFNRSKIHGTKFDIIDKIKVLNQVFPSKRCFNNSIDYANFLVDSDNIYIYFGIFHPYNSSNGFTHFVVGDGENIFDPTFNLKMKVEDYCKLFHYEIISKFKKEELINIKQEFVDKSSKFAKENFNLELNYNETFDIFNYLEYIIVRNDENLIRELFENGYNKLKINKSENCRQKNKTRK